MACIYSTVDDIEEIRVPYMYAVEYPLKKAVIITALNTTASLINLHIYESQS